jgi:hypothetical protein
VALAACSNKPLEEGNMGLPYTDDELAQAQAEARRLLRTLIASGELNLTELCECGWVRDPERDGCVPVDSRAWALMTALLELAWQAIDEAEQSSARFYWSIVNSAEKFRGLSSLQHNAEQYREKTAKRLGA